MLSHLTRASYRICRTVVGQVVRGSRNSYATERARTERQRTVNEKEVAEVSQCALTYFVMDRGQTVPLGTIVVKPEY